MFRSLTSQPPDGAPAPLSAFARFLVRAGEWLKSVAAALGGKGDNLGTILRVFTGLLFVGLLVLCYRSYHEYSDSIAETAALEEEGGTGGLPHFLPLVGHAIGCSLALVSFLVSLWIRNFEGAGNRRETLIVIVLWIVALAGLLSWMPGDVAETHAAFEGKALAGEIPSIWAYLVQILLLGILILSFPLAAMVFFRLSLMDQYVIKSFLSPFALSLGSFIAIWLIADLTDKGPDFAGLSLDRVLTFYVVQMPYVILFVMPIVTLLSALFSMSNLSRSNELVSMIGAGRSVFRILAPLLVVGLYCSLACLALKYEWAPNSVGYAEALHDAAREDMKAKRDGKDWNTKDPLWARRGWMHVNELDKRTWFVGKVPFDLSDPMGDIVVWQLDESGNRPEVVWKARRGQWDWETASWTFRRVKIYRYGADRVPRIESMPRLEIPDWAETPWMVLSSSQEAEHLGVPGLTMYLEAHKRQDRASLAPFRTNLQFIFAEPATCFVMLLAAAPLGIVYSRRGAMAGVTGAIGIFALMYVLQTTLVALGQADGISPFFAAWGTNFLIAAMGAGLLWFRARNREVPALKSLLSRANRKPREIAEATSV